MIERLFKGSMSLAVLILVAGIVAAPLVGSDRAFEIAPVFSLLRGVANWVTASAEDATTPEDDPRPFTEEAADAAGRLREATEEAIADVPAFESDPRLSVCPQGSIEPLNTAEVPLTTALDLQQAIDGGEVISDLVNLQARLSEPACNWKDGDDTRWRWLAREGRIIDARQSADAPGVTVTFTNF